MQLSRFVGMLIDAANGRGEGMAKAILGSIGGSGIYELPGL